MIGKRWMMKNSVTTNGKEFESQARPNLSVEKAARPERIRGKGEERRDGFIRTNCDVCRFLKTLWKRETVSRKKGISLADRVYPEVGSAKAFSSRPKIKSRDVFKCLSKRLHDRSRPCGGQSYFDGRQEIDGRRVLSFREHSTYAYRRVRHHTRYAVFVVRAWLQSSVGRRGRREKTRSDVLAGGRSPGI